MLVQGLREHDTRRVDVILMDSGCAFWYLTHWGRDKWTAFSNGFFLNGCVWIPIKIPLKFVPKGPINKIPALVQVIAWHRPGDKPLSGQMMVSLPTHICVTRPQWVNDEMPSWMLYNYWSSNMPDSWHQRVKFYATCCDVKHLNMLYKPTVKALITYCVNINRWISCIFC